MTKDPTIAVTPLNAAVLIVISYAVFRVVIGLVEEEGGGGGGGEIGGEGIDCRRCLSRSSRIVAFVRLEGYMYMERVFLLERRCPVGG